MEGEMAGELLAVPGPSGMCAGSSGSAPPVPVGESAAAATPAAMEPTVVELVVTELLPAVPAMESEDVQSGVSAAGLLDVGLPEPAAQAASAAPATEAVTAVRLVSEALSALDLGGSANRHASSCGASCGNCGGVGGGFGDCRGRAASAGQWISGSLEGVLGS